MGKRYEIIFVFVINKKFYRPRITKFYDARTRTGETECSRFPIEISIPKHLKNS